MAQQQLLSQHPLRGPPGQVEALGMNGVIKAPCPRFRLSETSVVSSQAISTNLSTQIPGCIADTGDTAPLGANEVQNIYQSTFEICLSSVQETDGRSRPQ